MMEKSPIKPFPRAENIHAVANPFLDFPDLITVNLYIVGKGPVTLVDTGPKLQGSLDFTREQMQQSGFDLGDIERIIITHGHLDHFGLALSLREAARHPIDCFVHAEDKWRVVSEDWVRRSSAPSQPFNPRYGLLWWLYDDPVGYAALGYLDTNLYVFPELDLVIVRMQSRPGERPGSGYERTALPLFKRIVRPG